MNTKLKVAVVGVGFFGERHAKTYFDLPEVELVAVVDANLDRAKEIAEKYNCAAFSRIEEIVGKVDAANVVTHTSAHYEVAKRLLVAGIDLLIEKPITTTLKEADEINKIAKENGRILTVGHIERFNPAFQKLSEHVTSPRFIECHRVGPFLARATDVPVVLDLMIHDIDLILSLIPSEPVHIDANGCSVITNEIDIAHARITFENGAVANITGSRVSEERVRKIRVFQKENYLSLNFLKQELAISSSVRVPNAEWPTLTTERYPVERTDALKDELTAFIHAVKTQSAPAVSGEDARRALSVALQIVDIIKASPDFRNNVA
ncbi:MAG: Gfo/Idh/MocA family oxidoreductase [Nitrospirota bacterium]